MAATGWEEVEGSASGTGLSDSPVPAYNPYIAVDSAGRPAIVWAADFGDSAEIHGKWFRDGLWQEISPGSATAGGISDDGLGADLPRVGFDSADQPVVAWYEWADAAEVLVRALNGSSWLAVTPNSSGLGGVSNNPGISRSPFLVMNGDEIILAWQDTTFGQFDILVAHLADASFVAYADSLASGGISDSTGRSEHPKVALAAGGVPVVAYEDNSSGSYEVFAARYNGDTNTWQRLGAGSISEGSGRDSRFPDVVVDADGRAIVGWTETLADGSASAIYLRVYDGDAWQPLHPGSASGAGAVGITTEVLALADLELDANGDLWMVYTDSTSGVQQVYVQRFDGVSWNEVGEGSSFGQGISDSPADVSSAVLALTASGHAYVVWSATFDGLSQIYGRLYRPQ